MLFLRRWLTLAFLCSSASSVARATNDGFVYVGTYTDWELLLPIHHNPPGERSQGIYVFRFDSASGNLTPAGLAAETANPTYLTISPSGRNLYAVNEIYLHDGAPTGTVSAFAVDPTSGKLTLLNQIVSRGTGPCYAALDHTGHALLVANFGSGSVAVLPVAENGSLRPAAAFEQDTGSGPNPRQAEPHAHAFNLSPDNHWAIASEFGTDRLRVYQLDPMAGKLTAAEPPFTALKPGSAPRHLAFHPNGRIAYSLNEIDSTLTTLSFDSTHGTLQVLESVSTLPADFDGKNTAAEVLVHPSGKFLYASNRGHHSVAVFAIDETGRLKLITHVPSGGKTPRGMTMDASGRWLLVVNQDTHNLAAFAIDQVTGVPKATGQSLPVRSPVGVKFWVAK